MEIGSKKTRFAFFGGPKNADRIFWGPGKCGSHFLGGPKMRIAFFGGPKNAIRIFLDPTSLFGLSGSYGVRWLPLVASMCPITPFPPLLPPSSQPLPPCLLVFLRPACCSLLFLPTVRQGVRTHCGARVLVLRDSLGMPGDTPAGIGCVFSLSDGGTLSDFESPRRTSQPRTVVRGEGRGALC